MLESIVRFTKSYELATLLGGTHALLAGATLVLQLLGAWNDMNPTMIVLALIRFVDYPLILLANAFVNPNASSTRAVIFLAIAGTIMWTLLGFLIQSGWRAIGHGSRRKLADSI